MTAASRFVGAVEIGLTTIAFLASLPVPLYHWRFFLELQKRAWISSNAPISRQFHAIWRAGFGAWSAIRTLAKSGVGGNLETGLQGSDRKRRSTRAPTEIASQ